MSYSSKNINHLGIVSGIFDLLQIQEVSRCDALTLSLFNRGQGGLILRDFELDPSGSAPGVFEVLLDEGGEPAALPQELRIAGGSDEPIRLTVRYQPEEGGAIDQALRSTSVPSI